MIIKYDLEKIKMKKILIGLLAFMSLSAFCQDISCALVGNEDKPMIKIRDTGEEKIVEFVYYGKPFSGIPSTKFLYNDKGVHTGYHERILGRENGEITKILNIYYNLDSEIVGAKYVIVDRASLELECKFE